MQTEAICINVREQFGKWMRTQAHWQPRILAKLRRLEATTAADLPPHLVHPYARWAIHHVDQIPDRRIASSEAALACYHSHMRCWQLVLDENLPMLLVLEDDARVDDPAELLAFLNDDRLLSSGRQPPDWDLILLGYTEPWLYLAQSGFLSAPAAVRCADVEQQQQRAVVARRLNCRPVRRDFWGLHCYLISSRGAQRLLQQHQSPGSLLLFVDTMVNLFIAQGLLDVFVTPRSYASQEGGTLGTLVSTSIPKIGWNLNWKVLFPDGSLGRFLVLVVIVVVLARLVMTNRRVARAS